MFARLAPAPRIVLVAVTAGLIGIGLMHPADAQTGQSVVAPAATLAVEAGPFTDVSAQQRRDQRPRARAPQRARGQQIACTRFGCRPIPRGCRIVTEFTPWGNPTGFDAVVCP